MPDYDFEFVDAIADPFKHVDGTDKKQLRNFYHVAEMNTVKGSNRVEYGGESPWIHCWQGAIPDAERIDDVGLADDATVEERIEHEVDRLMTFLVSESATPHKTSPEDFDWTVTVHSSPETNPVVNGRMIQVVWKPE